MDRSVWVCAFEGSHGGISCAWVGVGVIVMASWVGQRGQKSREDGGGWCGGGGGGWLAACLGHTAAAVWDSPMSGHLCGHRRGLSASQKMCHHRGNLRHKNWAKLHKRVEKKKTIIIVRKYERGSQFLHLYNINFQIISCFHSADIIHFFFLTTCGQKQDIGHTKKEILSTKQNHNSYLFFHFKVITVNWWVPDVVKLGAAI